MPHNFSKIIFINHTLFLCSETSFLLYLQNTFNLKAKNFWKTIIIFGFQFIAYAGSSIKLLKYPFPI